MAEKLTEVKASYFTLTVEAKYVIDCGGEIGL